MGAGILGAVVFYYFKQYRTAYLADKDAMYRHYIQLHPDEFLAPGLYLSYIHSHSRGRQDGAFAHPSGLVMNCMAYYDFKTKLLLIIIIIG